MACWRASGKDSPEVFTRLGPHDGKIAHRRAALLAFCAESLDVAPKSLSLTHDPLGAPLLLIDGAPGAWTISSASRDGFCLFGLARGGRIGVDVEVLRPIEPPWAALHPRERAALRALTGAARENGFYRIWTVKEAYLKALGLGLRRAPESFCVEDSGGAVAIDDPQRRAAPVHVKVWREGEAVCALLVLPAG